MPLNPLTKPKDSDTHTYTDFWELLCLTSIDRECSIADMEDQIQDSTGGNRNNNTKLKLKLNDTLKNALWRAKAFGEYYPFSIDPNGIASAVENQNLTIKQKLYCFLLFSSNLPFISKDSNYLTDTFENIAFQALKETWPNKGKIVNFGKATSHYTGLKYERMNKVFTEMGNKPHFKSNSFRPNDSGDGGIDLAAWLHLDQYELGQIPSALAQCACSRDEWRKKQHEVSIDSLSPLMQVTNRWLSIMFTPICFRDNFGRWPFPGDVHQLALYDRLRIAKNFTGEDELNNITFPPLFDALLNTTRDLV